VPDRCRFSMRTLPHCIGALAVNNRKSDYCKFFDGIIFKKVTRHVSHSRCFDKYNYSPMEAPAGVPGLAAYLTLILETYVRREGECRSRRTSWSSGISDALTCTSPTFICKINGLLYHWRHTKKKPCPLRTNECPHSNTHACHAPNLTKS
jgi:hypothetical protein